MTKKSKVGLQADGDIATTGTFSFRANRASASAGGGGDFYGRHFYAGGSIGGYHMNDGATEVLYVTVDSQPANMVLLKSNSVNAFGINVATGGIQAFCTSSTDYSFRFSDDDAGGAGTIDAGFKTYVGKANTTVEFYVDGVKQYTMTSTGTSFATTLAAAGIFTVAGATTLSGTTTVAEKLMVTQATSPANLTANQNNWNPIGSGTVVPSVVRVSANAGISLTGLIAGVSGQMVLMLNVGSNSISISHQSVSSSAANQFDCPGSTGFTLRANGGIFLWYDGTSTKWRVVVP